MFILDGVHYRGVPLYIVVHPQQLNVLYATCISILTWTVCQLSDVLLLSFVSYCLSHHHNQSLHHYYMWPVIIADHWTHLADIYWSVHRKHGWAIYVKNTVVIMLMSADRNSGFCIIYHWYMPLNLFAQMAKMMLRRHRRSWDMQMKSQVT